MHETVTRDRLRETLTKDRVLMTLISLWDRVRTTPFVEPRFSILYGIAAGIFLSAAVELLLNPFTSNDKILGYLWIAGALFLVSSAALGIIAWEMQSFNSHLVSREVQDASTAVKRDELENWGHLRWLWISFVLCIACTIVGVVVLVSTRL